MTQSRPGFWPVALPIPCAGPVWTADSSQATFVKGFAWRLSVSLMNIGKTAKSHHNAGAVSGSTKCAISAGDTSGVVQAHLALSLLTLKTRDVGCHPQVCSV